MRLRAKGIPISVTALSYWQSGKRQPERPSSISAVRALEDVLGLSPGELLSLLPPPRPRGAPRRRAATGTVNFPMDALRALLERVGAPHALEQQHRLNLVSLHDRCEIAADGGQRLTSARAVFQATADGQDRWLLVYDHGGAAAGPPYLRGLRNCRAGRVEVADRRRTGLRPADRPWPDAPDRVRAGQRRPTVPGMPAHLLPRVPPPGPGISAGDPVRHTSGAVLAVLPRWRRRRRVRPA